MHQRYVLRRFLRRLASLLEQRTRSLLNDPVVLLIIPIHLRRSFTLHGPNSQLLLRNDNYGEARIGLASHAPLHLR